MPQHRGSIGSKSEVQSKQDISMWINMILADMESYNYIPWCPPYVNSVYVSRVKVRERDGD